VLVEFSDEEWERVRANAAAGQLSDGAWIAMAAIRVRPPGGESVPEALRDALRTLMDLRRQLAGAARNLNQLTAARHATGEDPGELPHQAEYVRQLARRIDDHAAVLYAEARSAL
jgi:hypothetical protein